MYLSHLQSMTTVYNIIMLDLLLRCDLNVILFVYLPNAQLVISLN